MANNRVRIRLLPTHLIRQTVTCCSFYLLSNTDNSWVNPIKPRNEIYGHWPKRLSKSCLSHSPMRFTLLKLELLSETVRSKPRFQLLNPLSSGNSVVVSMFKCIYFYDLGICMVEIKVGILLLCKVNSNLYSVDGNFFLF